MTSKRYRFAQLKGFTLIAKSTNQKRVLSKLKSALDIARIEGQLEFDHDLLEKGHGNWSLTIAERSPEDFRR